METNHFTEETLLSKVWNFDCPIAEKTVNGINYRIAEGFIKDRKKTYLLYKDGIVIGTYNHVYEAKKVVDGINLVVSN